MFPPSTASVHGAEAAPLEEPLTIMQHKQLKVGKQEALRCPIIGINSWSMALLMLCLHRQLPSAIREAAECGTGGGALNEALLHHGSLF